MLSPTPTIIRSLTRKEDDRLNILMLTLPQRWYQLLVATQHNIYWIDGNRSIPLPPNVISLDVGLGQNQIPPDVIPDLVVCPHEEVACCRANDISTLFHAPLAVCVSHFPDPAWTEKKFQHVRGHLGHQAYFPGADLAGAWGCSGIIIENARTFSQELRELSERVYIPNAN